MSTEVTDNPTESRYELAVDGELAGVLGYRQAGDALLELTHTIVMPAFRGKGVAGALAEGALDAVRAAGGRIIPSCPYLRETFLPAHPDYQDLVA